MIHIHYTEGPESLRDISLEISNQISDLITEGHSDSDIASTCSVSQEVVSDIRYILSKKLKRCCFCGSLFDSKGSSRRMTCYKEVHYLPCVDCGTPLKVIESYANYMKAGGRRCPICRGKQIGFTRRNKSQEEKDAIVAKQEATMMERYGAKNALQVPEIKAKVDKTVKERYGVDNLSQSPEIQDKIRKNSQEKYGVDHYSNAPEIRQRMIEGMIKKYGVDNAQKSKEIQEKTKQTNIERYGCENVFQNEEVRRTFVKNHEAKYGVQWPHQRPDLIEKVRETNMKKYDAPMYPVSDDYMKCVVSNPEKFENYKSFMDDPEKFIEEHYFIKPSVVQICEDTGVTDTTIYDKLISIGRRDLATEASFSMETQVAEFISSLDASTNIDMHNRSLLHGKEIDVYLPDFKIGFECNPTYTHNSSFRDPWGELPKHYRYHADKSKLAQSEGIFVYHIFGYEWSSRRHVIESQIRNLIGKNDSNYYARKTYVDDISHSDSIRFLEENHRQGSAQSSVRLGLRLKDTNEIVSLMTFGKMRPGIGKKVDQTENEWELIRFCNKLNTSVVGGASKLFKYFVENYNPSKVVSFSDVSHTRGHLYEKLGFKYVSLSDPGYVWVNLKDDSYYTRVSCQKQNLPKLFSDVTEKDIAEYTEKEIMMSHGYAQVFDSGVIRWEYNNV